MQFTPDIPPSGLGTLEAEQGFETISEPKELKSLDPVNELTSEEAISLCSEELTWGDSDRGGCRTPGGIYYWVWIKSDEVFKIEIDAADPNQLAFLLAADDRAGSIEDFNDDVRLAAMGVIGFFIEIPVTAAACSSIVGCTAGVALLSVTGYGISKAGDSIIDDIASFDRASVQTEFLFCQLQGNSDEACRDAMGLNASDLGESND